MIALALGAGIVLLGGSLGLGVFLFVWAILGRLEAPPDEAESEDKTR